MVELARRIRISRKRHINKNRKKEMRKKSGKKGEKKSEQTSAFIENLLYFWSIIFIVVLADRMTKNYILNKFSFNDILPIIKGVLYINVLQNTGAGFGLLENSSSLLMWLSIIALGMILYSYDKISRSLPHLLCFALMTGGIIGNLIDRCVYGFVLDFIDFGFWPVFNLADAAMTTGLIIVIIITIFKKEHHKIKHKEKKI